MSWKPCDTPNSTNRQYFHETIFFPTFEIQWLIFHIFRWNMLNHRSVIFWYATKSKGTCFSEKKHWQLGYNVSSISVRTIFFHPRVSSQKNCVRQKNNVLGVVDLFESEIFTANFQNQGYSFAEWTSGKNAHDGNLQPKLPGEKSGPWFCLKKKTVWFG